MYFSSIRGLLLTCFFTLCLSCGGGKSPSTDNENTSIFPARKAYVVIRSEGGPANVQRARNILSSDFAENNVRTEYSLYRAKQSWNQNQIFNTAYEGEYDYIILIDQVAKFTIDNQTQVGGKYQIRSYHIKSTDPNWLDLGQSTCNLSVVPSVQKFSREVIRSIVGNQAVFKGHDIEFSDTAGITDSKQEIDTGLEQDMTSEIEKLRRALEEERKKTQLAEEERSKLENQLKVEIETQKQKARIAEIEAEDAALKQREKQREIAEAYVAKREEIKKRDAEVAQNEPIVVDTIPKELTKEERLSQREATKERNAKLKEAKRKEIAAAAQARKQERQELVQLEREEKRRLKEELEAQRKEKARLAEEDIKRIKAKVAEERRQAEELLEQKKEAERLAKLKLEEEMREAEILDEERKKQAKIDQEQAEALAKEQRASKRKAREEENKRQEAELKAQRLEEKRLAELRLAELARQSKEKENASITKAKTDKGNSAFAKVFFENPNALIIIKGKEEDKKRFEDLEDFIEFDLMFAKIKSRSVIFNKDQSTALNSVLSNFAKENNILVLIDQKDYVGEGASNYKISIAYTQMDSDWKVASIQSFDLNLKADLKQLSRIITEYLSN